jgi:hypothetical protein
MLSHTVLAVDINAQVKWNQDIDYFATQLLERHVNLFRVLPQAEFERDIAAIRSNLSNLTDMQISLQLMAIAHKIGDGHTSVPLWNQTLDSLPVKLRFIDDALYVTATTEPHSSLLGTKLRAINDTPIEQVVETFASLTPFSENRFSTGVRVAEYITFPALLHAAGFSQRADQVRLTFEDKQAHTVTLNAEHAPVFKVMLNSRNESVFDVQNHVNENLWFAGSTDKSSVYIYFRRYTDQEAMTAFASSILTYINTNGSQHLIIDLRDNYGGDFFIGLLLAAYVLEADSLDWNTGVFVLTNNGTFSAAMSNAAQFKQLLNARLVGEPTGARPSGPQDMGQFTLPNSGLLITYSKRIFHFTDDDKDAVYPDVPIPLSIDDMKAKRDPQLSWIFNTVNWN